MNGSRSLAVAYDLEELKFGGMIVNIAEGELSASIDDDEAGEFAHMLYEQYKAAGAPKNKREWIRHELKKHFLFVTKPPVWIERTTGVEWPFFQGKPMVFIEQLSVPENEVTKTAASPDVV